MSLDCLTYNTQYNLQLPPTDSNLPYVALENESLIYVSPNRISVHLSPANIKTEVVKSKQGNVYVTNQRLIFISENHYMRNLPDVDFDDFVLLINKNLYSLGRIDGWFGSNKYSVTFKPSVEGAGLNHLYIWNLTVYFNNGGVFDFDTNFQKLYNEWKYQQQDILPEYHE